MVLFVLETSAQKNPNRNTGIFFSIEDLIQNNISMFAPSDELNRLDQRYDEIILVRKGIKSAWRYGNLSGYYKDGFRFRAYGRRGSLFRDYGYYRIIDDSSLIVYSKRSSSPKTGGHTWYYYSLTLKSPIKRIIPKNLKADFLEHPEFLELALGAYKNGIITDFNNGKVVLNELYDRKMNNRSN